MSGTLTLSRGAILYVSVGFTHRCFLQILSLRLKHPNSLSMIVYDGQVYAGAFCTFHSDSEQPLQSSSASRVGPNVRELDVIESTACCIGGNEPMQLKQMRVVMTGLDRILGQQVLTLQQYMRRRRFTDILSMSEIIGTSSKQIKLNQEENKDDLKGGEYQEGARIEREFQERNQDLILIEDISQAEHRKNQQGKSTEHSLSSKQEKQSEEINEIQAQVQDEKEPAQPKDNQGEDTQKQVQLLVSSKQKLVEIEQDKIDNEINQQEEGQKQKTHQNINPQKSFMSNHKLMEIITYEKQLYSTEKPIQGLNHQKSVELASEKLPQLSKANLIKSRSYQYLPRINSNPIQSEVIEIEDSQQITQIKNVVSSGRIVDLQEQRPVKSQDCMKISQLYQRMHRFKILARINFIWHYTTQKGKKCTKMMVVDREGEQILIQMIKRQDNEQELLKGRTYYFENGQVEQDQTGTLYICMPWSGVKLTNILIESFQPYKMRRVHQVPSLPSGELLAKAVGAEGNSINKRSSSKQINVVGILQGFKDEPKLVNNQFRTLGVLLQPQMQTSIIFCLFLDELSSFPKQGSVISVHNMRIAQYQGTFKLQSSKRSYYLHQKYPKLSILKEIYLMSTNNQWKMKQYRSLSQITYVIRNISDIKKILASLNQNDHCFSEIDCSVANISEKKEFMCCANCHHQIKACKGQHSYCFSCKKVERVQKRFMFRSEVADSTGSIDVSISNPEVDVFLGVGPMEYAAMDKNQRVTLLELAAYQGMILRVKSQRVVGGCNHFVTRAQKANMKRSLDQIKEKQVNKRISMITSW